MARINTDKHNSLELLRRGVADPKEGVAIRSTCSVVVSKTAVSRQRSHGCVALDLADVVVSVVLGDGGDPGAKVHAEQNAAQAETDKGRRKRLSAAPRWYMKVADPQRAHEFEPRKSAQIFGVPFPEGRVLRSLANDGVFHDRIAEVVDYRCDGKHATEAFVKSLLLRVGCRPSEEHGDDCGVR